MTLQLSSFLEPDARARLTALLRISPADAPLQRRGKWLLLALALLTLAGVAAGLVAFFEGHHVLGTTNDVPWGILIGTYVFFVASATGLCLVSSLGHVFGYELFQPLARKATFLALLTLCIGFAVIATELEFPFRLALYAVISPNLKAPIWWMGALYGGYMLFLAGELFFLMTEQHDRARLAGILGIIAAVAAQSNLGSVFGLLHARPHWFGPFLPIYFIVWALICGAALLILVTYITDFFENGGQLRDENRPPILALGKLLTLFIGIVLFFTGWKMIAGIYGGHQHEFEVVKAVLTGPLFLSFWGLEMLVGLGISFGILLSRRRTEPRYLATAAVLPMIGILFVRYNFVYTGQMFPMRPLTGKMGEAIWYYPSVKGVEGFLPYTPSIVEVLIVLGALAAAVLGYVLGHRLLRLEEGVRT
jgi:Ni/Fe-hydrogenase subunit HybB-like protein